MNSKNKPRQTADERLHAARIASKLTTTEFSAFCDQVEAWAANELGVTFYDLAPREGA